MKQRQVLPLRHLLSILLLSDITVASASTSTSLNRVAAASCRAAERQGGFGALDSLQLEALTCPDLLAEQDEIFELFMAAADLPNQTTTTACYLHGFRTTIADQIGATVAGCASQVGTAFKAGLDLGRDACQIAAHAQSHDLLVALKLPNPAPAPGFATRLVPLSSTPWRDFLALETLAGTKAGCLIGLQRFARQDPLPFVIPGSEPARGGPSQRALSRCSMPVNYRC